MRYEPNNRSPKLLTKCFEWFCDDDYYEELQGDLEETFHLNVAKYGLSKARRIYCGEVLLMLRPSVIKKFKTQITHTNNIDMIRNYLKIAVRNILGQKVYSTINILGLAVGMTATILIALYVQNELSYDTYHDKSDRIYRASREWLNANGESSLHLGHLAPPFGPYLASDMEGVLEEVVRINSGYNPMMSYNDKKFEERGFFWAEDNLFNVFSWKLIAGDPKNALKEPNSIILTKTAAEKYYGDEDPMGKSITFNNFGITADFKITGIIEDTPPNSHFKYNMFASFVTLENFFGRENLMQNWGSNNYSTYILLEKGKHIAELEERIPEFIDKHLGEIGGKPASTTNKLHFMPLADIHLHSHLDSEIEANGDIKYVYTYTIIAIFILVIACINFMNLSTARSMKRAKEVGMRKVMGAYRSSLIRQFITESTLIATISAIIALGLVLLVLPWFNNFSGKQLSLNSIDPLFLSSVLITVVLTVGLLAGSYPAFVLSSFTPVKVLKGSKLNVQNKINLRSTLVVFQFFISICLLIGVGVVNDQIEYMKTKNLGFSKENKVVLPSSNEIYVNFAMIRDRLVKQQSINDVTLSSRVPSGRLLDSQGGEYEIEGEMRRLDFRIADIHVDHSYLKTLGVKMLAGRNFDPQLASDSTEAFVINKAAVDGLGYTNAEEAIGKKFNYGGRNGYIIGVCEDFHFESLHQEIAPITFQITNGRANNVIVSVNEGYEEEAIAYLREEWTSLRAGYPFDYFTIGDRFNAQYEAEEKLSQLVNYFSVLAIFVAMLGLFGLSSFNVEQNVKQIGIRKVLGASINQVVYMFTKRFAILVVIGIVLAIPVSYFGMKAWLGEFPYATNLEPSTFIIGSLVAFIFALITVSFEIIKGAMSNPIDSLRSE